MNETTCCKTYQEKLRPTPKQERELEHVLWHCRALYNTALEQRITAWQRCHLSVTRYEQEAELKATRAAFPEYAAIHSHLLQDVLARLDKTYQAFFRRLERGEKAGFHRYKGKDRYHSFTFKEYGNGARLDNGFLVLSKIGRISVRWSRPLEGTPKTVTVTKKADGWYVSFSCAEVPAQPLPPTGQETGIDLGLESFATLADGTRILTPGCYRKAERYLAKCQRRVSKRKKGSARRRKAVCWLAKAHQTLRRQRADFHHRTALELVQQYDVIYHEDLHVRNLAKNHHRAKSISDAGWRAFLTILSFKSCKCWENSGCGESCVHEPSLFRLRRDCRQRLVCPLAQMPELRSKPAQRPQRRQEYPMARAAPSGTRGAACGDEPRTHGAASPCGVSG
jgi:putative transposase